MDDSYLIGSSTAYNRDRISHSHSFLLEAMAEVLVNPEMTNKRKGKKSEDGPRKNKIKKEPRGTIQGGTMCLEGLAQYEKDKVVLTEIPQRKTRRGKSLKCKSWRHPSVNTLRCPHLILMISWRNSTSINPRVTSINAHDAK